MRSHSKDGSINETMILQSLHDHQYKDLSDNWKRHMKRMFKDIQDEDYIKCHYHPFKDAKPDLDITVNNRTILLSVKSGHAPTVHSEPIYSFLDFLRKIDVPERIIRKIAFYHYGHSYKENKYYTREEIIEKYPELLKEVNAYFISHNEVVREIIYRAIIRGRLKRDLIDYFYYGNSSKGFLLSVVDILKIFENDKDEYDKTLRIKQLTYVAGSRNKDAERAKISVLHWPVLCKLVFDEEFMKKFG